VSFEVHPAAPSTPLAVPAGTVGPLVEFAEHAALDPATGRTMMFVRVVQVNEGNGPAAPPPSIRLAVGAGPATAVGIAPTAIGAQPGTPAGIATLGASSDDVHLVEVEVIQPQTWHLQIANTDTRDHRYTWVVADTVAATLQPWLDVPVPTLAFEALTHETTPPQDVAIANYGPGPLTLNDPDGTDLGSGFRLLALTPHVIGGNHRAVASFGFTAPDTPGTPATTHTFASNDPAAGSMAGHGNRIALTATVHPSPRWRPGDILVISGLGLCRLDAATGELAPVTSNVTRATDLAVDPTTGDAVVLGVGFLKRVNRFSGVQTPLGGGSDLGSPAGVAVGSDGAVVYLHRGASLLLEIDRPAGQPTSILVSGLGDPRDIALEASGDVLVANGGGGGDAIVRISLPGGRQSRVASSDILGGPVAVAVEHAGTILAIRPFQGAGGGSTFSAGALIRINPQTHVSALVAEPSELTDPRALAVANDGTILVAAAAGVFALNPVNGALTQLTENDVRGIAVVPSLPG
jgi:hypothetical protein